MLENLYLIKGILITFSPPNILNVSQIPLEMYDDNWATVINNEEANYSNKPFSMKVPNNKVSRNSLKK